MVDGHAVDDPHTSNRTLNVDSWTDLRPEAGYSSMRYIDHEFDGAHRLAPEGTTCRLLMIGEDNPQSDDDRHALYPYPPGCAGHRLSEILGLDISDHLAIWRTNLCNPRWSTTAAVARRDPLLAPGVPWSIIFLLGRKVAGVFEKILGTLPAFSRASKVGPGLDQDGNLSWATTWAGDREAKQFGILVLPHPSGRNLIWNDRENWRLARQEARAVTTQTLHNDIPFGLPEEVENT